MSVKLLHHQLGDKTWFLSPVTVVEETSDYVAFRISAGSETVRACNITGSYSKSIQSSFQLKKVVWDHDNLNYVVPFNQYIGYGCVTDSNLVFKNYYLNFQLPTTSNQYVINTMDLELDFIITDYEQKQCYWKDLKAYQDLKNSGLFHKSLFSRLKLNESYLFESLSDYKIKLDTMSKLDIPIPSLRILKNYLPEDSLRCFDD